MCDCCSFGPRPETDADQFVMDKPIPSSPKKPQAALPANEMQEVCAPEDLKEKVTFVPQMDLFFDPKEQQMVLLLDLPGAAKEDLALEVGQGYLCVSGPRPRGHLKERFGELLQLLAHERPTGFFCRRFQLPCNALEDTVNAQLNAGVLEIKFKCVQHQEKRRVDIGAVPADKTEKTEKKAGK
ncbi:small heat shock protein 20, putative [Eimeria necatrix]|uniref:Small heat shock protein 20, putative n=1 Tax=Eimeria necatrix TaxID=51315 RepID=U6MYR4_9EIME|nr:small heat shock protein 20, putative [Eimeria necatrix]CDJ69086.1 small heat shock protein 20, putative [Eimeria necatrix]